MVSHKKELSYCIIAYYWHWINIIVGQHHIALSTTDSATNIVKEKLMSFISYATQEVVGAVHLLVVLKSSVWTYHRSGFLCLAVEKSTRQPRKPENNILLRSLKNKNFCLDFFWWLELLSSSIITTVFPLLTY